jgi:IS4 transposase
VVLERFCARLTSTLRGLSDNRAELVGQTRFFRNEKVSVSAILSAAGASCDAVAAGRHVVLVEDTSEINYQSKAGRKRDLGRVGNDTDVGLFVHPALALEARDGTVLGLAGARIWRRHKRKAADYQEQPFASKESYRWLDTARAAQKCVSSAAVTTTIADREGEIYEVFARLPKQGRHHLIIRATARNRAVADAEQSLLLRIAAQEPAGTIRFELPGRPGRTKRTVVMEVRFCSIQLRQPKRGAEAEDPATLALNFIEVREIAPPEGEQALLWRLFTTHAVQSLAQASEIVRLYRLRWTIEQLFRTLKSDGLGAALERLAATALRAAVKVMQLVNGRGEAGQAYPAELAFAPQEIIVLQSLNGKLQGKTDKQKNPHKTSSLAWSAWIIARLGGWTGYAKERPPGPITFVHGLQRFHAIAEGFSLASGSHLKQ